MERNIFGIRISTVPSESAFSTSSRVLDSLRSSLRPKIIEPLICLGDWFRSANSSSHNVEEYEEDLAELENITC
ncbi:Putative AC9 transposase [Linum perenne]